MTPILEDARPGDPRWECAFLDLAHGLVMVGAKAKIIERFTDLSHRRIRSMYRALRGMSPPAGPVTQGSARFFAVPTRDTSEAWSIQCAIFLECFERTGRITTMPLHRGWRLLAAFKSYLSITEKLNDAVAVKRLDVNQAYALLTYCGFMTLPESAELQRRQCPVCMIKYPIVASEKLTTQRCPVCAINADDARLNDQASAAAIKSRTPEGP